MLQIFCMSQTFSMFFFFKSRQLLYDIVKIIEQNEAIFNSLYSIWRELAQKWLNLKGHLEKIYIFLDIKLK